MIFSTSLFKHISSILDLSSCSPAFLSLEIYSKTMLHSSFTLGKGHLLDVERCGLETLSPAKTHLLKAVRQVVFSKACKASSVSVTSWRSQRPIFSISEVSKIKFSRTLSIGPTCLVIPDALSLKVLNFFCLQAESKICLEASSA